MRIAFPAISVGHNGSTGNSSNCTAGAIRKSCFSNNLSAARVHAVRMVEADSTCAPEMPQLLAISRCACGPIRSRVAGLSGWHCRPVPAQDRSSISACRLFGAERSTKQNGLCIKLTNSYIFVHNTMAAVDFHAALLMPFTLHHAASYHICYERIRHEGLDRLRLSQAAVP